MNENDGTTTSSPGPIPSTTSARCRAVVQELTATPCSAPTSAANSRSKRATRGPWATQPERTASAAAWASSSPSRGNITGIRFTGSTLRSRLRGLVAALPRSLFRPPPVDQALQPVVQSDLGAKAQPLGGGAG